MLSPKWYRQVSSLIIIEDKQSELIPILQVPRRDIQQKTIHIAALSHHSVSGPAKLTAEYSSHTAFKTYEYGYVELRLGK